MKPKNIILITIDALRADHLGCYGYERSTSPNIDRLAKNGVIFENVFSTVNATDPSLTTILSGKYPVAHGIRNHGEKITEDMVKDFYNRKILFLSEILRKNNYYTIGLDWLGRWHKKGFEYYFGDYLREKDIVKYKKISSILPDTITKRMKKFYAKFLRRGKPTPTASDLTGKAIELLGNRDKSFFLFIHYWDTHTPYYAPENIYAEFKPNKKGKKLKELLMVRSFLRSFL